MDPTANPIETREQAFRFLTRVGASGRLLRHAELVANVATELAEAIVELGIRIDCRTIELAAVLHDAGKIVFPAELTEPGRRHEAAGEQFLKDHGVSLDLARFCRTHGLPASEMPAIEDLVVAVADKLWRGARNQALEAALIDAIAEHRPGNRWAVFSAMDDCFEQIALQSELRLAQQQDPRSENETR